MCFTCGIINGVFIFLSFSRLGGSRRTTNEGQCNSEVDGICIGDKTKGYDIKSYGQKLCIFYLYFVYIRIHGLYKVRSCNPNLSK